MASMGAGTMRRRGGVVNYAEGGSGDEFVDDSGDSDYIVGQDDLKPIGSRSSTRRVPQRSAAILGGQKSSTPTIGTPGTKPGMEIDRSYLGEAPPTRLTTSKLPIKTPQKYMYVIQLSFHCDIS